MTTTLSKLTIAHQCPYAGGPAVYIARGLLQMVNDSIEYFDDIVCLQAGYYRVSNDEKILAQEIKILPNPSNTKVEVLAINVIDEPCRIEIFDCIGQLVYSNRTEVGVLLKTIDVSGYSPGVYTIRIQHRDKLFIDKLTVIR